MAEFDVDLFVIGGGSGGVRAARIAAGHGARVMIAEEYRMGGTCVIRGCVPKKLMVYASHVHAEIEDAAGFGWTNANERRLELVNRAKLWRYLTGDELFDIDWDLLDERDLIVITNTVGLERSPKLTAREAAALLAVARLRAGDPPIVGRIVEGRLTLDPRTVPPERDERLVAAVRAALAPA